MPTPLTAVTAAVLAPLYLGLSLRVIHLRRTLGVGIGHGGKGALERAVRVHGNFAEYVPFALVLLGLAEAGGAPAALVGGAGAALVAGRGLHAWGLAGSAGVSFGRFVGTTLTFVALAAAAVGCAMGAWGEIGVGR